MFITMSIAKTLATPDSGQDPSACESLPFSVIQASVDNERGPVHGGLPFIVIFASPENEQVPLACKSFPFIVIQAPVHNEQVPSPRGDSPFIVILANRGQ